MPAVRVHGRFVRERSGVRNPDDRRAGICNDGPAAAFTFETMMWSGAFGDRSKKIGVQDQSGAFLQ
ncbi:MAG: hypothetical protein BGO16_05445 [Nitrobacter sp. 62-23]|nr:MAG: hypothetical protein BGO16_05445 [Nitrobacter sp. 62-23]